MIWDFEALKTLVEKALTENNIEIYCDIDYNTTFYDLGVDSDVFIYYLVDNRAEIESTYGVKLVNEDKLHFEIHKDRDFLHIKNNIVY